MPEQERSEGRTVSWLELLNETAARFDEAAVSEAHTSARRIVEEASGWDGGELALHLNDPATERGVAHLDAMIGRRLAGEPLQYVVGRWSFRTLDLMVDRRALIPRPETEEVVGWAMDEARRFERPRIADLGTGTGAIGLSMAAELDRARVHLTDVSEDAVAVATANLVGIGRAASSVSIHRGSWFAALPVETKGELHVIVSNPPYVGDGEVLPEVVTGWEPQLALRAGPDGLRDLLQIVDEAPAWLTTDGSLVLEMAPDQTPVIAQRCAAAGFDQVQIKVDLSERPRAVVARR